MKAVREDVESRVDLHFPPLNLTKNLLQEFEILNCDVGYTRDVSNKYFQSLVPARVQHENFLRLLRLKRVKGMIWNMTSR